MAGENRGLVDFRNWQNPGVVSIPDGPFVPEGPVASQGNMMPPTGKPNALRAINPRNPLAFPVPEMPIPPVEIPGNPQSVVFNKQPAPIQPQPTNYNLRTPSRQPVLPPPAVSGTPSPYMAMATNIARGLAQATPNTLAGGVAARIQAQENPQISDDQLVMAAEQYPQLAVMQKGRLEQIQQAKTKPEFKDYNGNMMEFHRALNSYAEATGQNPQSVVNQVHNPDRMPKMESKPVSKEWPPGSTEIIRFPKGEEPSTPIAQTKEAAARLPGMMKDMQPLAFEGQGYPKGMNEKDIESFKNLSGQEQAKYIDLHNQINNSVLPDGVHPWLMAKNMMTGNENWQDAYEKEKNQFRTGVEQQMSGLLSKNKTYPSDVSEDMASRIPNTNPNDLQAVTAPQPPVAANKQSNPAAGAALPQPYERNAPTVPGMGDAAKRMNTIRADIPLMNAQEAAKQSGGVVPDVLPMGTKGGQRTVYTPGKDGRGEYQIYGENGLQGTMSVPAGFMGKDGRQGGGTLSVLGGRTTEEQAAIDERVKQIDSQTAAMRGLRNAGRLAQGGITVEQEDQQNAMAAMMNRLAPPPDMSGFEDRQKALMGQLSAAKDIRGFGKRGQRKDAIDAAQIGLGQLANEQQLATQSYNQNRNAAMQAWQGQQQQDAALSTAQQKNYFDNLKFQAERGDARAKLELDAAIATNNADNEGQRRYMDGEKLKLDAYKALNPSQGKNPIFGLPLDMDGKFNFNAFDQMIGATAIDPKNPGKPKPGSVIRDGVTNLYHFVDDKGNVLSKGIPAVEMGKRYQYSGGIPQEAQQ